MNATFRSTLVSGLCILLSGCTQTTTGIWGKSGYIESVSQIFISPEEKRLIVIGKKYHYIFAEDSAPLAIFTWAGRENLRASFLSFVIDENNTITGEYNIDYSREDAPNEDIHWLEANQFQQVQSNLYRKTLKITGTRYLAGNIQIENSQHLNREYLIRIETPYTTAGIIGRIALTPIAIAEDGVATVGLVALLIVAVPFVVVYETTDVSVGTVMDNAFDEAEKWEQNLRLEPTRDNAGFNKPSQDRSAAHL